MVQKVVAVSNNLVSRNVLGALSERTHVWKIWNGLKQLYILENISDLPWSEIEFISNPGVISILGVPSRGACLYNIGAETRYTADIFRN